MGTAGDNKGCPSGSAGSSSAWEVKGEWGSHSKWGLIPLHMGTDPAVNRGQSCCKRGLTLCLAGAADAPWRHRPFRDTDPKWHPDQVPAGPWVA